MGFNDFARFNNFTFTPSPATTTTTGRERDEDLKRPFRPSARRNRIPIVIMKTFQFFTNDDVVTNVSQRITAGLWTGGTGSLSTFFTSSVQSGSTGDYYYDVYNGDPSSSLSEVQFAVAYGHVSGGGSPNLATDNNSTLPTQAVYSQYRNILLDPSDVRFTMAGSINPDDIYVINFQRARQKQKIDKGNWELTVSGSGGAGGSFITLIDDSVSIVDTTEGQGGRVYNVVSGALDTANQTASINLAAASEPSGGYGLFYPDVGIIIFNPLALSHSLGLVPTVTATSLENNHGRFLGTIQSGSSFEARNEENVTSRFYFCRVKNRDFNFSNNPSFYTGSDGAFRHTSFVGDPKVYLTTIGLYSDRNELLAVAKLSQPLLKSFDREALIKVKLDF
jgi:hypothetical protein